MRGGGGVGGGGGGGGATGCVHVYAKKFSAIFTFQVHTTLGIMWNHDTYCHNWHQVVRKLGSFVNIKGISDARMRRFIQI